MLVKIQYTTQLKAAIGFPEEEIQMPDGSTIFRRDRVVGAQAYGSIPKARPGHVRPNLSFDIAVRE